MTRFSIPIRAIYYTPARRLWTVSYIDGLRYMTRGKPLAEIRRHAKDRRRRSIARWLERGQR